MFRNVLERAVTCLVILDWFVNRILCNHTEHSRLQGLVTYNWSSWQVVVVIWSVS